MNMKDVTEGEAIETLKKVLERYIENNKGILTELEKRHAILRSGHKMIDERDPEPAIEALEEQEWQAE